MKETTALGAALAGAMGTGLFRDLSDFKPVSGHTTFEPRTNLQGMHLYVKLNRDYSHSVRH